MRYILIIVIVASLSYFLFGRETVKTIPVKAVDKSPKVVEKTVSAAGIVTSEQEAELSFATGGKVATLNVNEGTEVSEGDLIAQLDIASLVNSAQAYKDARDVALRDRDLYIEKYLFDKSAAGGTDEYDISLRRLEELLSQAEANYQLRRVALSDAYIYAPFSGIVYDISVEKGENVTAAAKIAKIANPDLLQFEVDIDQEDFGLLKVGQKAYIELDSFPNQKIEAVLKEMPVFADGASGSQFTIKLSFIPSQTVNPILGMSGDVHIVVASTNDPVTAVLYDQVFYDDSGNPFVWTLQNGLINKMPVDLGLEGDIYYEVKTPLNDKEVVIGLNDDITVKDGFKGRLAK